MTNEQVEKTLSSLDGLQRAPANPFLYQKIRQRMDGRRAAERVNPALAWRLAAACLLLLGLNVLSLVRYHKVETVSSENPVQQLYSEYISNTSLHGY
ncbi:MAG TPA: hypothetical protein VMF29_07070 [Candidatus Edwardsbacteria bacterium]|nr:hypothetical protein [Candidatus Edwardsbacteria bacterium]